jgi:hypothetical protein
MLDTVVGVWRDVLVEHLKDKREQKKGEDKAHNAGQSYQYNPQAITPA